MTLHVLAPHVPDLTGPRRADFARTRTGARLLPELLATAEALDLARSAWIEAHRAPRVSLNLLGLQQSRIARRLHDELRAAGHFQRRQPAQLRAAARIASALELQLLAGPQGVRERAACARRLPRAAGALEPDLRLLGEGGFDLAGLVAELLGLAQRIADEADHRARTGRLHREVQRLSDHRRALLDDASVRLRMEADAGSDLAAGLLTPRSIVTPGGARLAARLLGAA